MKTAGLSALVVVVAAFLVAPTASADPLPGLPVGAVNYQLDASHDGRALDPQLVAPLTKAWSIAFPIPTTTYPLIVGDRVFVTFPGTVGNEVDVESFDLDNGNPIWGPVSFPSAREDGALAYDNGRLFLTNLSGSVAAYDAETGALDWSDVPVGSEYVTQAPLTTYDGTLYFPGFSTDYAINEATGAVEWSTSGTYGGGGAPSADSSGVYFSAACKSVSRTTFSGTEIWTHTSDCTASSKFVVLHHGAVYAHSGDLAGERNAYPGPVYSERTGRYRGTVVSGTPPAFESDLMVGVQRGRVSASNIQSGVNLWNTKDDDYALPALLVNGYAAVADTAGDVRLLDAQTGAVKWSGSVADTITPPDEYNDSVPTGMAEGSGHLAVASDDALTVFASAASPAPRVDITGGPILNSYTAGDATFRFTSDVPGATYLCTVDGDTEPCTSPDSTTGLSQGSHTFRVLLADDPTVSDHRRFNVDLTAPTARVRQIALSKSGAKAAVVWSGSDHQSAVRNFDVRDRVPLSHGHVGVWQRPTALQRDIGTAGVIAMTPAKSLCVSVRARDLAGNVSSWSSPTCSARIRPPR